ncbi:MAG: replicative DNA helicase [Candidatus Rokubacteria bacterium]|nr:replicative DNA helicase [Candidatus Rokubacteria bacterium]
MADYPSRIPPHNLDAERAVLGAVLLEGRETLPRVIELLRSSDFYTEAHRIIFDAMLRLFDRGHPVDLITLNEELRRSEQLQAVGGPAALAQLAEEASIAAHLNSYAAIVRDMAVLRELIQTSTEVITEAFEAKEDVQTLVDDAERRIFALAERRLEGSALPVGKILKNTFEYIERLYERKEHVTGVATGFEKLDMETSGFQPSDFIIIAGRPSMGKAQPLDAPVKTVTGWKRMGDLRLGDALASIDGRPSFVSGIFPQGRQQIHRVTFSDGRSTECTAEHLWRVHDRRWREPRVLTTERVAALLRRARYRHRLWIDAPSGDFGHDEPLPIDPWLLGARLGDGKLSGSSLMFSTADAEIRELVLEHATAAFALRAGGGDDWRIVQAAGAHRKGVAGVAPNTLMESLRRLGLWGIRSEEKFIPAVYLNASRDARLALLSGLMDTDGWVERWGSARFCSTSARLARDVADLVRSLGGWCSVRRRRTTYSHAGTRHAGRPAYVCNIQHSEPKTMFQLSSKRARPLSAPRRRRWPVFVSVEPTRLSEAQCIAVTHPSRTYITGDYVVTHNTAFALNIAQHVGVHLHASVLVLSLEMSSQQLVQRMLCSEAKVDSQSVRTGYLTAADWHRLTAAAGRLSEAKIYIDDSPGITVLEARAKARRMKAEHGLDLVVIDYLQLMRGRASMENRQQEISEISRSLKALAKELNIPVVALSQLSRAVESRAQRDFRPQLSDLRECVTADTVVLLSDGRRAPIRELVDTSPEVLAMSPAGKIVAAKSERIWKVGTRPVFRVGLASGRTIRATAEHRVFTGRGWQTVTELIKGDRVALARHLPEPLSPESWPDARVALLGQLIGDGSSLSHQPLRYTTGSEENSAIVAEAAREEFGCDVTRYRGRRGWHQLLISGNGDRWHPRGVNAWLRQLGIFGQRSHEKRVPEDAFRLSNAQIALLLRHLWATDGTIVPRRGRGSHSVFYSTNSAGLATDVAALLMRLGIVARISSARKGTYRTSFFVSVSGGADQRRFLDAVGAFGPREPQARALAAALADRDVNTNVDTLPREVFERVKRLMRERRISQRRMAGLRGTAYGGTSQLRCAPSRAVVAEYANILCDEELEAQATSDLFWDRVVRVAADGEEDVFDLTVPGPASWLADGIVSHNSGALEQDADLILFLYRSRVYKEDVPPEEEKIAEVIIGKQRNGPIGTVKLVFLPEYARFENIADPARASQPF